MSETRITLNARTLTGLLRRVGRIDPREKVTVMRADGDSRLNEIDSVDLVIEWEVANDKAANPQG